MIRTVRLSCIDITGELDENTPQSVLREIECIYGLEHSSIEEIMIAEQHRPGVNYPIMNKNDEIAKTIFNMSTTAQIKNSSILGKQVSLEFDTNKIMVNHLKKGLYILSVHFENDHRLTRKIVIH